jgi:hypothetical protein
MRDYSKVEDFKLITLFSDIMKYDPDDFGKSPQELTKSYPNDFWRIYREIEHRQIYRKHKHWQFIGIVGTRKRDDAEDLALTIEYFRKIQDPEKPIVIVSGLCPKGGDRFATLIYQRLQTMKLWFPAEWQIGRHAGFVRNTEIARWSDYLIAVVAPDRKGGTEDTVKKFTRFHGHDNLIII